MLLLMPFDQYYLCHDVQHTDRYVSKASFTVSFSAVGNPEQEKQKIPRKSFSILPMLPRLSNPRKIRSVKPVFMFLSFSS